MAEDKKEYQQPGLRDLDNEPGELSPEDLSVVTGGADWEFCSTGTDGHIGSVE